MTRALMPNMLTPQDLEPNWEWDEAAPPGATPRSISSAGSIMTGCAATGWPAPGRRLQASPASARCCCST
jgi:hypothetical protein